MMLREFWTADTITCTYSGVIDKAGIILI